MNVLESIGGDAIFEYHSLFIQSRNNKRNYYHLKSKNNNQSIRAIELRSWWSGWWSFWFWEWVQYHLLLLPLPPLLPSPPQPPLPPSPPPKTNDTLHNKTSTCNLHRGGAEADSQSHLGPRLYPCQAQSAPHSLSMKKIKESSILNYSKNHATIEWFDFGLVVRCEVASMPIHADDYQ